jgi:type I restriction enzyme S subunit
MTTKIDISPEQLAIVQGILKDHLPNGTLAWAFGSRVTWTAKPFSDLDIALEGTAPLAPDVLIDLEEAFDSSDLPWKVDVIDLNAVSPEFRAIVERQRVPADWKETTVGEIFDLENGHAFKSAEFESNGVPVIKIKNVKAGYFSEHEFDYVSETFLTSRPKKIARRDDLLISMSGNRHDGSPETWVGKVARFSKNSPFLLNQRVGALRLKKDIVADPRFFSYLLSSRPYQELFISIATSSGGQANLSPKQIFSADVMVPPLSEQIMISNTLGALDDKIELNRRMNETLESMARAVFRDWFVDFGPTRRKAAGITDPAAILGGLLPDPTQAAPLAALFPDSFGDNGLPEGWEWSSIGNELQTVLGGTPSRSRKDFWEGDIPWINSGKANEFRVLEPSEHITQLGFEKSATKLLPKRTTLIAITGATLGQVSLNEIEVCANQSIVGVVGSKRFPNEFVYCWIQESIATLVASQTGGAQQHINKNNVNALSIIKPSEAITEAWDDLAVPLFDLIASNCFENQTLAATRDLLLPKLMSGDLRLTCAEAIP